MHSVTFDILNKTSVFGILVPNSKVDIIICISKITNKFIRINIKVASFYYAKCLQSVGALLKLREMQCVSFAFSKRGERNKFCMIYHACLLSSCIAWIIVIYIKCWGKKSLENEYKNILKIHQNRPIIIWKHVFINCIHDFNFFF